MKSVFSSLDDGVEPAEAAFPLTLVPLDPTRRVVHPSWAEAAPPDPAVLRRTFDQEPSIAGGMFWLSRKRFVGS